MENKGPRIEVKQDGDITVVYLLDKEVLEEHIINDIAESLFAVVSQRSPIKLVVSFKNVKHLSSSALGTLIRLNKQVESDSGTLALCDLMPSLYEIFIITKLNKLFGIYDTQAMAMSSLKA